MEFTDKLIRATRQASKADAIEQFRDMSLKLEVAIKHKDNGELQKRYNDGANSFLVGGLRSALSNKKVLDAATATLSTAAFVSILKSIVDTGFDGSSPASLATTVAFTGAALYSHYKSQGVQLRESAEKVKDALNCIINEADHLPLAEQKQFLISKVLGDDDLTSKLNELGEKVERVVEATNQRRRTSNLNL